MRPVDLELGILDVVVVCLGLGRLNRFDHHVVKPRTIPASFRNSGPPRLKLGSVACAGWPAVSVTPVGLSVMTRSWPRSPLTVYTWPLPSFQVRSTVSLTVPGCFCQ